MTALVKTTGDTTLGIGDGANDVGMIQEAHIGESPALPHHNCDGNNAVQGLFVVFLALQTSTGGCGGLLQALMNESSQGRGEIIHTHTHTRAQRLLTEWDKIITACC